MPIDFETIPNRIADCNDYQTLIGIVKAANADEIKAKLLASGIFGAADDVRDDIEVLGTPVLEFIKTKSKDKLAELAQIELRSLQDIEVKKARRIAAWQAMIDKADADEEAKQVVADATINAFVETPAITEDQFLLAINAMLAANGKNVAADKITFVEHEPKKLKVELPERQGHLTRDATNADGDVKYSITNSTLTLIQQAKMIAETFFRSYLEHEGLHHLYLENKENGINIKDSLTAAKIEIKDVNPNDADFINQLKDSLVDFGFTRANINTPPVEPAISSSRAVIRPRVI